MLKTYLRVTFLSFIIIFFLFGCSNKKKFIYFQGSIPNSDAAKNYSPLLKSDDLLSITVLGLDEAATKPFNIPLNNLNQNVGGYTVGAPTAPGYLIDSEGNIDFPVVGKIKLGGLTRQQAIEHLKEQLKPYLNNSSIILKILNYKITVLGEVRNPGTFTIPNERITLPEALGIAGDLLITGKRNNVMVIREENGKRTETIVDLTKKDIFNSPVFYLQQNDVVYVEPNRTKINSAAINTSNVSLVVSVISLFVTMAVLFRQ